MYFSAIKTGMSKVASIFGMSKVERRIEVIKDREVSIANSYLRKQYKRLQRYLDNGELSRYEKLSMTMIQRSEVYRLALYCHKKPDWYYGIKGTEAKALWRSVTKILKEWNTNVDITRVWIPKKLERYGRPLGVPSIEWRIVPAMVLNFMQGIYKKAEFKSQHGGMPFRGTKTFIEDMLERGFYKARYVWEFDFKGYFNNITHESVLRHLREIDMPETFVKWSEAILPTKPRRYQLCDYNREEDKSYLEYEAQMASKGNELFRQTMEREIYHMSPEEEEFMREIEGILGPPQYDMPMLKPLNAMSKEETLKLMKMAEDQMKLEVYPNPMHDMKNKEIQHNLEYPDKGMPQGLGPAPFWSSLVTREFREIGEDLIMYIDDGLIKGDTVADINRNIRIFREKARNLGVEIQESKSGMVVSEGEYLKNLKIIGVNYDGEQFKYTIQDELGVTREAQFTGNFNSQTNRGTRKDMVKLNLEKARDLLEKGGLSLRDLRLGSTHEDHVHFTKMNHEQQMKLLIKHNLLGTALAEAWDPQPEGVDRKGPIRVGVREAMDRMMKGEKSFGRDKQVFHPLFLEEPYPDYEMFQRSSTVATREFLRYLRRIKGR
jgi:hypothetical protein